MTPDRKNVQIPIRDIVKKCALFFDDKKAQDILIIDLRSVNSYLDFFLMASGNSMVHCRSLAREIIKYLGKMGIKQQNKSNFDTGWIILDYGELVIHVFTEELRNYYQIERLWADAERIDFRNINM